MIASCYAYLITLFCDYQPASFRCGIYLLFPHSFVWVLTFPTQFYVGMKLVYKHPYFSVRGKHQKKVDFLLFMAYTIDARSNFCSEQALEVVVIEETVTASVKVDIYISEADNRQKNLHPVP